MRQNHKKPVSEKKGTEKLRKCLMCRAHFKSAWIGERVCRRCKSTTTWQGGGMI